MILAFPWQPDVKSSLDGSNIQHLINVSKHFILKTFFFLLLHLYVKQTFIQRKTEAVLNLSHHYLALDVQNHRIIKKKKKKGNGHSINYKNRLLTGLSEFILRDFNDSMDILSEVK